MPPTANEILTDGTLSRNYDPGEFMSVMEKHDDSEPSHAAVRDALSRLDSGRFHDVLDAVHNHIAYSDLEGRRNLIGFVYSERLLMWVNVYARSQDLARFSAHGEPKTGD